MIGKSYVVENVAELYERVGRDLLNANEYSPRGIKTKEMLGTSILITNPRSRLVYNAKRKFNILHAMTEALMLHSKSDKVEHISEFNKNMAKFSDDGKTMHGSYGKRVSSYIPYIVKKLREDPDSRQAVLSIHQSIDLVTRTKDVPCTENIQFFLRNNQLHCIVNMRSNDILYGFQYDVVMFTMLQETIANTLGVELGNYIHNVGSLHVYNKYFSFDGYEMLRDMSVNSSPIEMVNNGTTKDWRDLAEAYTNGFIGIYQAKGTTRDIFELIDNERRYRKYKEDPRHYQKNVMEHAYTFSPEWAKPFIKRWNNL